MSDLPALVQYPKVDRIEVIDSTGRAFVAHYEAGAEVHIQDGYRTLKVFAGQRAEKES